MRICIIVIEVKKKKKMKILITIQYVNKLCDAVIHISSVCRGRSGTPKQAFAYIRYPWNGYICTTEQQQRKTLLLLLSAISK